MRRSSRASRPALTLLLLAAFVFNYELFLALLPPLLTLGALTLMDSGAGVGVIGAACAALLCDSASAISSAAQVTPWVPTPTADVVALLNASVHPSATTGSFLELGSGDGRNLLLALSGGARRHAHALGVEYSPWLVWMSRARAWWAGMSDRVTVHCDDLLALALPLHDDVVAGRPPPVRTVYLYLSEAALAALAPRLACAYAGRSVAILSRDFLLPGWGAPTGRWQHGRTALLYWDAAQQNVDHECPLAVDRGDGPLTAASAG